MRQLGEHHASVAIVPADGWKDVIPAAQNAGKGIDIRWVAWSHINQHGFAPSKLRLSDGAADHRVISVGDWGHHEPRNLPMRVPPGFALQCNSNVVDDFTIECGWDDIP